MNDFPGTAFFLGANNKAGYCSLFSEVYSPYADGSRYILKGGPGTGKSTFMKKIADRLEKKGLFIERCYCSADPNSLDAVIAPEINFSVFDGTAPHTFDPTLPGVTEHIVNLGEALNRNELRKHRVEISELTKAISTQHKTAGEFLYAAYTLGKECAAFYGASADIQKVLLFSERIAKRKIPEKRSAEKGELVKRFLSAITPDGVTVMYDTLNALCSEIITVDDPFGAFSPAIMSFLSADALKKGYRVYECYCPLKPYSAPEHIIIPELELCFFTENRYHRSLTDGEKTVHSSRFCDKESLFGVKEKLAFTAKGKNELINEAVKKISAAKGLHDTLEEYYIKAADFDKINMLCNRILNEI